MEALEASLKRLIIDALRLEDIEVADIDSEAPLFGDGLGLDSLDALELAVAIGKEYGVRTESDDERNNEIFRCVRTLAAHIASHRSMEGTRDDA